MTLEFPRAWSLLKSEGKINPYYYSMAYDKQLLSYEFYVTDFVHVWREKASTKGIIDKAEKLNYKFTKPEHVKETLGALNGCLFQQYGDDPVKRSTYKSDIYMRKVNPECTIDHEYTVYIKKELFKWVFDVKMMNPQSASDFLKHLNFSLFNMVHQLMDKTAKLTEIISKKDETIASMRSIVDDLHGESLLARYFGSEQRQFAKFQQFDYNTWARNQKIHKYETSDSSKQDILSIVDDVSKNEDIWEYSNFYSDSNQTSFDAVDYDDVNNTDNLEEVELKVEHKIEQTPQPSPRKRRVISENSENIESLSQSFHEVLDTNKRHSPERNSQTQTNSANPVQDIIDIADSVKNRPLFAPPQEPAAKKKIVRSKRKVKRPDEKSKARRIG